MAPDWPAHERAAHLQRIQDAARAPRMHPSWQRLVGQIPTADHPVRARTSLSAIKDAPTRTPEKASLAKVVAKGSGS